MTYPLYPYESYKLSVLFVYGTDLTREMNIVFVPETIRTLAILIMSFVSSATIALCLMRRRLKLRPAGFISAFTDIIITFIGGGNIRMQHKFERWFFCILLIGNFFIVSLFAGDLLDCIIQILNQRIIRLEQLAGMSSPIFIGKTLSMHEDNILMILRFVSSTYSRHLCIFTIRLSLIRIQL